MGEKLKRNIFLSLFDFTAFGIAVGVSGCQEQARTL